MFWKLKYKILLIKGLNFYLTKKKHIDIKNLNNYLGYKLNINYILNLNEIIFWTYILIFFLQNALRKNARVLFATKFDLQQKVFNSLIKNSRLQFQLLKVFTKWIGGCLSNFSAVRWFYFFNGIKLYRQCPDILILLEKKASDPLIGEAYHLSIPVVSYTGFAGTDGQVSYLLFGGNLGLESKKNNFFFFIYILKNMLSLESCLKKKRVVKPQNRDVRKKAFVRIKKNKAYRLFGSRTFNLWRSQFRFTVKLQLLKLKFRLVGKLLLRHFKINKHFFRKKSTLSYVEKLKRRNYSIKCSKNLRFFYIIERRILIVLARMYVTRVVIQPQLRFLIQNGYVSVDNETIQNPSYLVPHRAIIRVLKGIPYAFAKSPKSLVLNNLRWLYYKQQRKNSKKKIWRLVTRLKS
jgi:ribosomal protein S4